MLLFVLVGGALRAEELSPNALRRFRVSDPIPQSPVTVLAFKPDGKSLVTAASGSLYEWSDFQKSVPNLVAGKFSAIALTPDVRLMAISTYNQIQVQELPKSPDRETIPCTRSLNTLALSPDGSLLAAGNDAHSIEVWNAKTGKLLHTLRGHDAYLSATAFSPSGKVIASGAHDRAIRLWDATTGRSLRRLAGHRDQISALLFLPDGKTLVSSSWDRTIRVWDIESGKERQCLKGHRLGVVGISVDSKGERLASASLDGTARIWDLVKNTETQRIEVSLDGVSAVAWSPDGKVLAVGDYTGTTSLWDSKGHRLGHCATPRFRETVHQVHSTAISADGTRLLSGHGDSGIRLWDAESGKMVRRVGRMTDYVWSVQFSPNGKYIASAGRRNGSVHTWDANNGELIKTLNGQKGGISKILYSHAGQHLIAAGGSFDPVIYVWDIEHEKVIHHLEGHRDYIDCIAIHPSEKLLASASRDGTLRLWDLSTGKELKQLREADGPCNSVVFSPNGKILAACTPQKGIMFWDVPEGKLRNRYETGQFPVVHLSYSRDGRTLFVGGYSAVLLLEVLTESKRYTIGGGLGGSGMAVRSDGRRVVTTDADSLILCDATGCRDDDRKKVHLKVRDLELYWQDLSGDPERAYTAIWQLSAASEQSLPLFAKHLQPVKGADPKQVERWVADLASDRFRTRKDAELELEKLGELARDALERELRTAETLDHRRRIEQLLERIPSVLDMPEMVRQLRMVETLEIIANAEAKRLLERLAAGDPGARLTREAKATLARFPAR
jgi:WD40 repeat protein